MNLSRPLSALKELWKEIVLDFRYGWLVRSLINTLGYVRYCRLRDEGYVKDLRRVLENAKQPRLIAHPTLAKPLRNNMGWLGRWLGYRVVAQPYHAEDHISAMDYAILDNWKKPTPIQLPPGL